MDDDVFLDNALHNKEEMPRMGQQKTWREINDFISIIYRKMKINAIITKINHFIFLFHIMLYIPTTILVETILV